VLESGGLKLGPNAIRGQATLVDVSRVANVPTLKVRAEVEVEPFSPPLPPGMQVEKGRMTWQTASRVPVDVLARRMSDESRLEMTFQAAGKHGPQAVSSRVEIQSVQEISRTYEHLK